MNWISKFRFLFGIALVFGIIAVLFVYLNYSMSNIRSRSATLELDQYAVSANYGGVLRQVYVQVGDSVKEGDRLFELNSPELVQALADKRIERDSLLFELTDNGNILLKATADGEVREVNYSRGSFVETNRDIAVIAINNTDYVTGKFVLNAPDYARIDRANPIEVTLPDNTKLDARVFDITLAQEGDIVYTVVKARLNNTDNVQPTFTAGTPVTAGWKLTNNGFLETVSEVLRSFVKPKTQV